MLLVDSSSNHIWSDKELAKGGQNIMQYSAYAKERATGEKQSLQQHEGLD